MHRTTQLNPLAIQKTFKLLAAFSLALLLFSQTAMAQTAWGFACGSQFGTSFLSGSMYSIDLSNGNGTLLGQACGGSNPDLYAGEFIGGTFYALDNIGPKLVTVAANGNCTFIGNVAVQAGHTVSGLSHDLSTGTTYMLSTNTLLGETRLYTINISNGNTTPIGNIAGIAGGITLAIDANGNAYVIDITTDKIFKINLSNATTIGAGVALTDGVNPINLTFAQDADFDCAMSGALRGILYLGGGNARLGTLNTTTGVFTITANLDQEICAFSIDCENMVVPAMGEWALIILALSLMSLGTVFILRKRMVLAVETGYYRQPSSIPFHAASYAKALVLVLATMLALFAVAIWAFAYELTSADLPGALIASPIAAYLLHLFAGNKE